jgi:hypothetical protein
MIVKFAPLEGIHRLFSQNFRPLSYHFSIALSPTLCSAIKGCRAGCVFPALGVP